MQNDVPCNPRPQLGELGPIAELVGLRGKRERPTADQIYAAADKAISKHLPDDVRMEIIATIVMAVYDGTLGADDIAKRAHEYQLAFYSEHEDPRQVSLDKITAEGGRSLGGAIGVF